MKEGVDKLAPSAFMSPKQPLTHVTISNTHIIKYYEQTRCFGFACTLLHLEL